MLQREWPLFSASALLVLPVQYVFISLIKGASECSLLQHFQSQLRHASFSHERYESSLLFWVWLNS